MSIPLYQVDAFTHEPFAGNPAGVCLLEEAMPDNWMQSVAMEMNLSETAFVLPTGEGFDLRWFTPRVEVDLCGHATLASAHVLFDEALVEPGSAARFATKSGELVCRIKDQDWIEMDFPAEEAAEADPPQGLAGALGALPLWVGRNRFDYLILLQDAATVAQLVPDMKALVALGGRGFMVTAPSEEPGIDFVSRFFAPGLGVDEDPVTGSAHCCLGPYWAAKLGRDSLTGRQVSARGGLVRVRPQGKRVYLQGQAVTIMKGIMMV